jgi:hypothetical protein
MASSSRASDLITALQDVVGAEDDGLVVATVRHLLEAGRLTVLGAGTGRCPPSLEEQGLVHRCFVARVRVCKAGNGGYPMFGCRRHR